MINMGLYLSKGLMNVLGRCKNILLYIHYTYKLLSIVLQYNRLNNYNYSKFHNIKYKISILGLLIKPEYFYIIIAKERTQANRLRFCNDMLGGWITNLQPGPS